MGTNPLETLMNEKKPSKHYVDNKRFLACIIEYKQKLKNAREAGKPDPIIPDYAGECILKIAENLANRHYSFSRYSYRDEMISDGIENCIKYFDRFDETKYSNPHTYFTTICWQANVQRINEEKKNKYIMYKSFEREMIHSSNSERFMQENSGLIDPEMYDNIAEYIESYEKKEAEKKEKRASKIKEKKVKDSLELFFGGDNENE